MAYFSSLLSSYASVRWNKSSKNEQMGSVRRAKLTRAETSSSIGHTGSRKSACKCTFRRSPANCSIIWVGSMEIQLSGSNCDAVMLGSGTST